MAMDATEKILADNALRSELPECRRKEYRGCQLNRFRNLNLKQHCAVQFCLTSFRKKRFVDFLEKKYQTKIKLVCVKDITVQAGFELRVGTDVYNWGPIDGKLEQLKERLAHIQPPSPDKLISLLKENLNEWQPEPTAQEVGTVLTVGDGIATISGLEHAVYGEILVFQDGTRGMVQDLKPGEIGCILFGDDENIMEGSIVHKTGKEAGIPVGDEFLGRIVDALGSPIDGKGPILCTGISTNRIPCTKHCGQTACR